MRCDVNVSVRKPGGALGTRCEIKNVNSIRFVMQAIEYEARRQIEVIEDGGTVQQETRLFDPSKGETRSMRSKEHAHDYRYFPDPDLLPLVLDAGLGRARSRRPCRSCRTRRRRASCRTTSCRAYDAGVLVSEKATARLLRGGRQGPRSQARRQLGDGRAVRRAQQRRARASTQSPVSAENLGGLIDLIADNTISRPHRQGRVRRDGRDRQARRADRRGKGPAPGHRHRRDRCRDRPASWPSNADKVAEYSGGKEKLFGFFVGQVMKRPRARPTRRW